MVLHWRIATHRLNSYHDLLALNLSKRSPLRTTLNHFYQIGNYVAGLGMVIGIATLIWTAYTSFFSPSTASIQKRELVPIIPGYNVPFNDIPMILGALVLSQSIHELGHALAAALDNVQLLSAGFSLTLFVLPSAFVLLDLQGLRASRKMRIISAGPFHNAVAWSVLAVLSYLGVGTLILSLGYRNISSIGRVVLSIESGSGLQGHLLEGVILTAVDDVSVTSEDRWSEYLQSEQMPSLGWCVSHSTFTESSNACCQPNHSSSVHSLLACFVVTDSANSSQEGRCLDPLPILTGTAPIARCSNTTQCSGNLCVKPSLKAGILRLTFQAADGNDQSILWSGPRQEVLEQVQLGSYMPRTWPYLTIMFPLQGWELTTRFAWYIQTAQLSLFFLNMLPISGLDGDKWLCQVLSIAHGGDSIQHQNWDLETGASVPYNNLRDQEHGQSILYGTRVFTMAVLGMASVGVFHRAWIR